MHLLSPVSPSSSATQTWHLGLTGGIGSGKSTVLQFFAQLGADTINADEISHQVTAPGGTAMNAIAQTFGHPFLTIEGALDRDKMRTLVFTNPTARQELEAIIHPLVTQEMEKQARMSTKPCVVLDIPLLMESKIWRSRVHHVVLVDCHRQTQIERVAARSHLPKSTIESVIAAQASMEDRRQGADWVIWNEGISLATLQKQVLQIAKMVGLESTAFPQHEGSN
jgi:dephospho-CoA kinase